MDFHHGRYNIGIDDSQGGKITSIVDIVLKRNLLLAGSPATNLALDDGAVFGVYGWDEAVPSLEPQADVPTLGCAWRSQASSKVTIGNLITRWEMPGWNLNRQISVGDDSITAKYELVNSADASSPVIWAAHCIYTLNGLQEVILPSGAPIEGPGCTLESLMSAIEASDSGWRVSNFEDIGESWKFFLPADEAVILDYSDGRLTITTDAPWFGIWLNRGRLGEPCIAIEPTNAATDYMEQSDCFVDAGAAYKASWTLAVQTK